MRKSFLLAIWLPLPTCRWELAYQLWNFYVQVWFPIDYKHGLIDCNGTYQSWKRSTIKSIIENTWRSSLYNLAYYLLCFRKERIIKTKNVWKNYFFLFKQRKLMKWFLVNTCLDKILHNWVTATMTPGWMVNMYNGEWVSDNSIVIVHEAWHCSKYEPY